MKDFASFSGEGNGEFRDEVRRLSEQYDGKSETDMLKAIYTQAKEGKRNGTLTNGQIDAFYERFAPMLDGAKRKKLKKIVAELKNM